MSREFTELELEAYLDEALTPAEMAATESALRADKNLLLRLAAINARRDAGVHSVGEIWRRHRLSCPSREQLGGCLLGTLSGEVADYIDFHLRTVGCRLCLANLDDLRRLHQEETGAIVSRRTKYFESSAGYLRNRPDR